MRSQLSRILQPFSGAEVEKDLRIQKSILRSVGQVFIFFLVSPALDFSYYKKLKLFWYACKLSVSSKTCLSGTFLCYLQLLHLLFST